jgi:hypothetical protein
VLPANQFFGAGVFQLALYMAAIDDPRVVAVIPSFPSMLSWSVWLRIGGVLLVMGVVWLYIVRRLQRGYPIHGQEKVQ